MESYAISYIDIYNIDRIVLNDDTYIINDSKTRTDLKDLTDEFGEFKTGANSALDSFDSFKSTTETFINNCECSIEHIQGDEYALMLNM